MFDKIFVDEHGNKLDIHVLFPFKTEKSEDIYIAYAVGKNNSENLDVFISKIEYGEKEIKLLKIKKEDEQEALKEYNRIKTEYKLFEE